MSKRLEFICPYCKEKAWIQEVITPVTTLGEIIMFDDGRYDIESLDDDDVLVEDHTYRYLCGNCSEDLFPEIVTNDPDVARHELYEYLKDYHD